MKVNTIGDLYEISNKLPAFSAPKFSLRLVQSEFHDALTIALLAAIESLLSAVVADSMVNGRHRSNMELIAQGVGNAASALFGGIPATGAIARTAANVKNGGRTPVAGIVHSITLLLILVLLMPYAALIPMPAIAAILFDVAYNMCGWKKFVNLCKTAPKSDIAVLVTTFVLTVVFDLVVAIEVGMVLILRMRSVGAIDATALHSLELLYEDCKKKKITLILSHTNEQPMHMMEKAGFDQKIGREHFCKHIDDALEKAAKIVGQTA